MILRLPLKFDQLTHDYNQNVIYYYLVHYQSIYMLYLYYFKINFKIFLNFVAIINILDHGNFH